MPSAVGSPRAGALFICAALSAALALAASSMAANPDPRVQSRPAPRKAAPAAKRPPAALPFQPVRPPQLPPEELLRPEAQPYRLGVGDIVHIEVAGVPSSAADTFVTPDGRVYFDLAASVRAEGMLLAELEYVLAGKLEGFYRKPRVSVGLKESRSRRIWIIGSVASPGIHRLERPTRLVEAVARAGGLLEARSEGYVEEMADLAHSFVLRSGKLLPVDIEALLREGDLRQNIYLQPNDYVYIASKTTLDVFVLGAVKEPRAVGYQKGLSLLAALAYAGGPAKGAYYQRIVIVRGSLTKPSAAAVDFNDIMNARRPDVELSPGDVVWVPQSPWSKIEALIDRILNTSATTIATNEGINAAQGPGTKIGTSVNVGD